MKLKSKQNNNVWQFSSSQGETIKSTKKQCISKITVSLENQEFTLMIYNNSTIKKLALQLLLMLYDELLECQFNEDFKIIHEQLCHLLIVEINKVSKNQKNQSYKSILTNMIQDYQYQKLKQQEKMTNKYFIKNYIKTLQDQKYLSQPSESKSYQSKKNSSQNFKLYQKAQKSLQKKQKLQRENAEQKSKVQISYCTFHPNISKSQKKFKSKQKSNIYERLYSDADEIKTKIFLKKKQIQNQQEKNVSSLKFIPKINQCSKQIVEFKKRQNQNGKILFDSLEKPQVSFQASQNSSQKYLKSNESKQVFDKLYDSNFYDNRLNKTLQKVNMDKQNECSFHPQLSQGTKKLTLNYPKLQQRMKIYQMKKPESNQGFSPCSSSSKQKSLKGFTHKFQLSKLSKKEASHKNEKKGIKRMLQRIKTQPLQQVQICSNTINKRPKKQETDKYHSQIFELDSRSDFINDSFQVTPKKLNLETTNKQKAFFKNKQEFASKQKSAYSTSRLQNVYITEPSQQNPTKQQIFDKIFQHLSKGKDSINSNSILLSRTIPVKLKKAFEPLTSQLAEMNTQLDSEEFVWSLDNLYQQLDVENKALLLSWGLRLIHSVGSHVLSNKNHKVIKTEDSIFQLID